MSIVASCVQGVPWTDRMTCSFRTVDTRRPRSELIDTLRTDWIREDKAKATELGLVFTDGPAVDLLDATMELRTDPGGRRRPHYTLTMGRTSYYEFASTPLKLDRVVTAPDGETGQLRELLGIRPTGILDVSALPIPATVGSGTVAVSKDDRVLLAVRLRTFVAGSHDAQGTRRPVHVVAEGYDPDMDVDPSGMFSPVAGARRGLREELHAGGRRGDQSIAEVTELIETGFAFDQERCQPFFAFLAYLDRTAAEVQTGVGAVAVDAWEHETILDLPFDIHHAGVRMLLQGRHPDLQLASNHAAVALWFALLYKHGFDELRDQLTAS